MFGHAAMLAQSSSALGNLVDAHLSLVGFDAGLEVGFVVGLAAFDLGGVLAVVAVEGAEVLHHGELAEAGRHGGVGELLQQERTNEVVRSLSFADELIQQLADRVLGRLLDRDVDWGCRGRR